MKKISTSNLLRFLFILLIGNIIPLKSYGQTARGLDEIFNDAFMPIAQLWEDFVFTQIPILGGIPIVLIVLILGALFFTLYFGFVNIRRFPTSIQIVRGKYDHLESKQTKSIH